MKKLVTIALLAVAAIAVNGCKKEQTTEQKLKDAAAQAEKDASSGANDLNKKLDGALSK